MAIKLREMPTDEMPREKLALKGADALTDAELLAIILGSGTAKHSVLELAQMILNGQGGGGVRGLAGLGYGELKKLHGLGEAKATKLLAAFALGKRAAQPLDAKKTVATAEEAVAYFRRRLAKCDLSRENLFVLTLDAQKHPIGCRVISQGSVEETVFHPRDILREVIRAAASSFFIAHNHPSGNPAPSPEDIALTMRLKKASEIMMVELKDHLIITDGAFVSLADEGFVG